MDEKNKNKIITIIKESRRRPKTQFRYGRRAQRVYHCTYYYVIIIVIIITTIVVVDDDDDDVKTAITTAAHRCVRSLWFSRRKTVIHDLSFSGAYLYMRGDPIIIRIHICTHTCSVYYPERNSSAVGLLSDISRARRRRCAWAVAVAVV